MESSAHSNASDTAIVDKNGSTGNLQQDDTGDAEAAALQVAKSKRVVTLDVSALMKRPQHRTPTDIACLQQILLRVKFMPSLPQDALIGIAKQLEHRQLPAGATVVRQGDIGEEFFIVLRGVVTVTVRDSNELETQVAELREGASFGELALIEEGARRKATCICKEECSFAVIHKRVYDELLKAQNGAVLEDKIQLLSLVPVLREAPREAMKTLMLRAAVQEIVPGTIILNQDQEVEDLYVIVRGQVKHIRTLETCLQAAERVRLAAHILWSSWRISAVRSGQACRELEQGQVSSSDRHDVWEQDISNPFTKPKVTPSKYAHVKSPVAAYLRESSQNRRTRTQRKALLKSGLAKVCCTLRRAVAKILEARQRGILRVLNKAAVDNKKKPLPPHLARAFQHSTRIEEGNRLFLEIASASRGDFFGEQSLSKVPKSSTSVIASSTVTVLALHKWDVLNVIDPTLLAELPRFSVVANIHEELLVEQFYRHMRWEAFRKDMVNRVLRDRDIERMCKPKHVWHAFRSSNPEKIIGIPWR